MRTLYLARTWIEPRHDSECPIFVFKQIPTDKDILDKLVVNDPLLSISDIEECWGYEIEAHKVDI